MQPPFTPSSVGLLLVDYRGWILLQLRDAHGTYPDHWSTVGGAIEPGETIEEALVREVFEERRGWRNRPSPVVFEAAALGLWPPG